MAELQAPFATPSSAVARYADDGFVRVRGLFSPTTLVPFVPVLSNVAERSRQAETPMHRRTVYQRAFLQEMTCGSASPSCARSRSRRALRRSRPT